MVGGCRGRNPPLSTLLFMLVLALSSNCNWCPSAYGASEGNDWGERITVWVTNELGPNTPLIIHCKSRDDDLGEHTLAYKQDFHWVFEINFMWTTLFWCNMGWQDSSGRFVQASHDTYKAKKHYKRDCHLDCCWNIRKDGWYLGDCHSESLIYTWTQ